MGTERGEGGTLRAERPCRAGRRAGPPYQGLGLRPQAPGVSGKSELSQLTLMSGFYLKNLAGHNVSSERERPSKHRRRPRKGDVWVSEGVGSAGLRPAEGNEPAFRSRKPRPGGVASRGLRAFGTRDAAVSRECSQGPGGPRRWWASPAGDSGRGSSSSGRTLQKREH